LRKLAQEGSNVGSPIDKEVHLSININLRFLNVASLVGQGVHFSFDVLDSRDVAHNVVQLGLQIVELVSVLLDQFPQSRSIQRADGRASVARQKYKQSATLCQTRFIDSLFSKHIIFKRQH